MEGIFRIVKLLCMILQQWFGTLFIFKIHNVHHRARTLKYELLLEVVDQEGSSINKCITLMEGVNRRGDCICEEEEGVCEKSLYVL